MATKTIAGYTAASTIDPVNDLLLIEQAVGPVYKSISRNTLLGVTGTPADLSTAQAFTNKTIGNTNNATLKDGSLTLQNTSDVTKQGLFSLANVTTGNTRTYTLPNASVTLASLTGTETLTNKTLTAPAITGGSIDNSTITVDSISGHTTSTIVTVGGVQMNNGVVATANSISNNGAIAAGAVIPSSLVSGNGSSWTGTSFTPSWTNLTVGNGTNLGWYKQIGKMVFVYSKFIMGSTSAVGTTPFYTLPVAPSANYQTSGGATFQIGVCNMFVAGTSFAAAAVTDSASTTGVNFLTGVNLAGVTATAPATWATGNFLFASMFYEGV